MGRMVETECRQQHARAGWAADMFAADLQNWGVGGRQLEIAVVAVPPKRPPGRPRKEVAA